MDYKFFFFNCMPNNIHPFMCTSQLIIYKIIFLFVIYMSIIEVLLSFPFKIIFWTFTSKFWAESEKVICCVCVCICNLYYIRS